MSGLRKCLGLVAATVVAAVVSAPVSAVGAAIVPPGNSAVNQYTQTIPVPGGNVEVHGKGIHSPARVLGHKNARKLEQHGEDGKAAAELAAAGSFSLGASGSGDAGGGQAGGSGGEAGAGQAGTGGSGTAVGTVVSSVDQGSSGFGQILGQATGASSDGELGLVLPLTIFAGLFWCAAYFWRQRRTA